MTRRRPFGRCAQRVARVTVRTVSLLRRPVHAWLALAGVLAVGGVVEALVSDNVPDRAALLAVTLAAGVVLLVVFVRHERRRSDNALIEPSLLTTGPTSAGSP